MPPRSKALFFLVYGRCCLQVCCSGLLSSWVMRWYLGILTTAPGEFIRSLEYSGRDCAPLFFVIESIIAVREITLGYCFSWCTFLEKQQTVSSLFWAQFLYLAWSETEVSELPITSQFNTHSYFIFALVLAYLKRTSFARGKRSDKREQASIPNRW